MSGLGGVSGPRGVVSGPGGGVWSGGGRAGGLVLGGGGLVRGGSAGQAPPLNRMTNGCKNITLAKTSFRPVITWTTAGAGQSPQIAAAFCQKLALFPHSWLAI